ncbi:hypothetical protein BGX33_002286 [Mortierella sp. NVP41]|nr:hypothetical protein BGX33_002286 [Mortierella sp. NVP41]
MEPASRDSALEDADVGAQLVPTSPGSGLSRALCNFGFSCIDFVTGDNLGSSEPISSAHHYHHHWDRTLSSHDPTVDSAHTLVTTTREDGLEADSMILEDKKRSSSWARRVWRAL